MYDDRLLALSIHSIERDYVQKLDFEDIITDFASAKARKVGYRSLLRRLLINIEAAIDL